MADVTQINFTDTWGGKLDSRFFTTVRGQDKEYLQGKVYPVVYYQRGIIKKKHFKGNVILERIEWKRIKDFMPDEIAADIGVEVQQDLQGNRNDEEIKQRFYQILKGFYGKKGWWLSELTLVQKLYLARVVKDG